MAIRLLRLILEQPDVNFKVRRGKVKPIVQLTALIDLETMTSIKQAE